MAALRDKVWCVVDGIKYKGDITRVGPDKADAPGEVEDLDVDEIDANLITSNPPGEDGIVQHSVVGGAQKLKLAKTEADKTKNGYWWPRSGSFVADPNHAGRKRWEGE